MPTEENVAAQKEMPAPKSIRMPGDCKTILCERISAKLPTWRERVLHLLRDHGSFVVSEVTVEQIYGGIRGVHVQVSDISYVDPQQGIRIRGYTIPELLERLPKPKDATYPLAGGLYYLLMADELPTLEQALMVEEEWQNRSALPDYVFEVLKSLPRSTHPMTMLSTAILALQNQSVFARLYEKGLQKSDYWEAYLEDSLNLTAKLPSLAAYIYNLKYRDGQYVPPEPEYCWSGNFAHMIGRSDDKEYMDLCRLFFLLHCDHEGANVSAHASALVSSALSDVYYSSSAAMNGLAGPLHGLANQECLEWLLGVQASFSSFPTEDQLESYIWGWLNSGRIIPGYGHAVLRVTDPRFMAQLEFGKQHMPEDELFKLVELTYQVVPRVLSQFGKVKNPWPNVDAITGTLQYHFGLRQFDFYTVLFGVSRLLGLTSHAVWARALNKPIERPKSLTTRMLEEMADRGKR